MSLSLKERTRIAVLSFVAMSGFFIAILSFSQMVGQILNNTFSFKSFIFLIPSGVGLFFFFLAFNYLNQDEFAKVNTSEKK